MSGQKTSGVDASTVRQRAAAYRESFSRWRRKRPFPGAVLLLLGGLITAWVPIQLASDLMLVGRMVTGVGLLWSALMLTAGVFALKFPEQSNKIGIIGVVVSILSLFGALGGLLVGMVLGIVGGNLCYGWHLDDDLAEEVHADNSRFSWADEDDEAATEDGRSRIARLIGKVR